MSSSRYGFNPSTLPYLNASLIYISASRFENDWQSIPHIHHFSELLYITKGQGAFLTEGRQHPVAEGDLIILPPDLEHTERSSPSCPLEYIVMGIEGITFQNGLEPDNFSICRFESKGELLPILEQLLFEAEGQKENCSAACQALLQVLLIRVFRRQKLTPAPFTARKMTRECSLIKRYLDSNYNESITLDQLAALAHMSKYYLVHAFTRYAGLSPINYLNAKRIEVSRGLLTTTNHSIAQIASLVGFSSQSYFAQVFKRYEGKSPAQYRRETLGGGTAR